MRESVDKELKNWTEGVPCLCLGILASSQQFRDALKDLLAHRNSRSNRRSVA